MPKAVIVTLADEVADELTKKSGGWALSFEAKRPYQLVKKFEEIDTLNVDVFPAGARNLGSDSRGSWLHEYDIDVVFFFRASAKAAEQDKESFDNLQLLVEQVADHYKTRRATASDCYLHHSEIGADSTLPYFHEAIDKHNTFVSGVRLTFRKSRST
jgi:hypothetical protein